MNNDATDAKAMLDWHARTGRLLAAQGGLNDRRHAIAPDEECWHVGPGLFVTIAQMDELCPEGLIRDRYTAMTNAGALDETAMAAHWDDGEWWQQARAAIRGDDIPDEGVYVTTRGTGYDHEPMDPDAPMPRIAVYADGTPYGRHITAGHGSIHAFMPALHFDEPLPADGMCENCPSRWLHVVLDLQEAYVTHGRAGIHYLCARCADGLHHAVDLAFNQTANHENAEGDW